MRLHQPALPFLSPAPGFNDTGYHRLLTLLNTYTFYNAKRNQMVLLLTPSGFTNHATDPGLTLEPNAAGGGNQGSPHGGNTTTQDHSAPVATSRISKDPRQASYKESTRSCVL